MADAAFDAGVVRDGFVVAVAGVEYYGYEYSG